MYTCRRFRIIRLVVFSVKRLFYYHHDRCYNITISILDYYCYYFAVTITIAIIIAITILLESNTIITYRRPCSSEVPRNPLTRWDVSSIPANGVFLTKKLKNKIKMPSGWRTIKSLVHKIRLHGRRGKGMAESFSREKVRHAPHK